MTRRLWLFALVLLTAFPLFAVRRRSVLPGAGRCVYGTLDDFALVLHVAVDDTHVYWFDDFLRAIKRVPKNGGAEETLGTFQTRSALDIAVDDNYVYLSSFPDDDSFDLGPGEVGAVPKSGGEYRTLAAVQYPVSITADGTYVYWADGGTIDVFGGTIASDGEIGRIRNDGTGRQALASNLSLPLDVLLDGDDVYFPETGLAEDNPSMGIRRVAKTGGPITHVDDAYAAGTLSQTATDIVYYGGELEGEIGGLLRVPKSGGHSTVLVQDPDISMGPIAYGDLVYYLTTIDDDDNVALMRVPATGGQPEELYRPDMAEFEFTVDDCGLYWGTWNGRLVKVPR